MATKKKRGTQAEQAKRFIDMARELGVDESERGQERAFGKVGMKRPKARKKPTKTTR
jgi:hypothetical protein